LQRDLDADVVYPVDERGEFKMRNHRLVMLLPSAAAIMFCFANGQGRSLISVINEKNRHVDQLRENRRGLEDGRK
jgi:hypothetical protein